MRSSLAVLLGLALSFSTARADQVGITFYKTWTPPHGSSGFKINDNQSVFYIDAFTVQGALTADSVTTADIIFVTHDHPDHFDAGVVSQVAINTGALVVGPDPVINLLNGFVPDSQLVRMQPAQVGAKVDTVLKGVPVSAYYTHEDTEANAYRIMTAGGASVVHSGDCSDEDWQALFRNYPELYAVSIFMVNAFLDIAHIDSVYAPHIFFAYHYTDSARMYTDYPSTYQDIASSQTYDYQYATHAISINAPNGGEVASGTYNMDWSSSVPNCTTKVFVSGDRWQTGTIVAIGQPGSGQYLWNTTTVPDGIRYRARILSHCGNSFGWDESDGDFTVDNPGNALPEVSNQAADSTITGSYLWPWWSCDADGDQLFAKLAVRRLGQSEWSTVIDNLATDTANTRIWRQYSYTWNTDTLIDDSYQLKVSVFDGSVTASDSTTTYSEIRNSHSYLPATNIGGLSTIPFTWYVIHPDRLTGHTYEARFKPIVRNNYTLSAGLYPAEYKYDLWDSTTATLVWSDRELPGRLTNGVCSYYDPGAEFTGCVPTCGSASFKPSLGTFDSVIRPVTDPSTDTLWWNSITTPDLGWAKLNSNYEIRWHTTGTYPSDTLWPDVWDVTYNVQIPYDSTRLLDITIPSWNLGGTSPNQGRRYIVNGNNLFMKFINICGLRFFFKNPAHTTAGNNMTWATHPLEGDIWRIYCSGPIPPRLGDVYSFTPTGVQGAPGENNITSLLLHQNAPNPFKQLTTISYQLAKPGLVNLKVYNIAGQLVKTLASGQTAAGYHSVKWDGRDNQGNKVSSGIYIYRLQAGNKDLTRKLVILR